MSATTSVTDLSTRMRGRVVTPASPDWDATRQVFNLTTDLRPAAIALPRSAADVAGAVDYARASGLRIAPQGGGHNAGAYGSLDDSLLVDVRELQEVTVDAAARSVRVGAGVRWKQVVPQLSEAGLGALHGSSPEVGIAGYSLGGGMGWLARKHGLQTNSVTAFDVVTADGTAMRVDPEHEPDLFWALRGGNGNFAVVTAIEFDVYEVEALYAGAMFFPFERSGEVLHAWNEAQAGTPDELMTWVKLLQFPDAPDVPEPLRGEAFAVVLAAFLGTREKGEELLRPIRALRPAIDTFDAVKPAALGDLAMDPHDPLPIATTSTLVDAMPSAAIDQLVEAVGPGSGSPLAMVELRQMGGALARSTPGAGARATLPGELSVFALGVPVDEASAATTAGYLESVERIALPYRVGYYPNFVEDVQADASLFFDPQTWKRLRAVKGAYDPEDLLRGNHRIPPA